MAGAALQGRPTQTLFIADALSILWAPKERWARGTQQAAAILGGNQA